MTSCITLSSRSASVSSTAFSNKNASGQARLSLPCRSGQVLSSRSKAIPFASDLREPGNYEDEDCAEDGQADHRIGAVVAVRLGKDIAGADIEQKADKEAQIEQQPGFGYSDDEGGEHTENGAEPVQHQEEHRAPQGVLIAQHERNSVQAVREIMCDHRKGDHEPHAGIDMEPGADAHAIQKAMQDQRRGADHPDNRMVMLGIFGFMAAVDHDHLFDRMDRQEAGHNGNQDRRHRTLVARSDVECFRKNIEKAHGQQHAGGEAHHKMHMSAIVDRE